MQQPRNIVGARIRQARNAGKPKVTLKDLSARLETIGVPMDFSSISKIEQGKRAVTDIQLMAFAEVLRISPVWLLGLTDNKHFNPRQR